jgi:hypothetical protein
MKDNPVYAQLLQQMRTGTDAELLADLTRFVDSFADHDEDCPGYGAVGRDAELAAAAAALPAATTCSTRCGSGWRQSPAARGLSVGRC